MKKTRLKSNTHLIMLVSKEDILGQVANHAVAASPFIPLGLEIMLTKLSRKLNRCEEFKFAEKKHMGFLRIKFWDLDKWLTKLLMPIQEFRNLNLSLAERKAGIKFGDKNRAKFVATSRYWDVKKNHDFVCLAALVRNVCNSIETEYFKHK